MNKRNKKTVRSILSLILAILIFPAIFLPANAAQQESRPLRKVRVGYLIYQGYQEGEGDAPKSGYGYEYLQQIAYYAGWEYEYVNGSFSQLLEMLKNGEIDLMGDLSYTEERAESIRYAREEQGREYYYLFVREDRQDISATDPSTLQGARVGINKGSVQVELFRQWCQEQGVECEILLYENSAQRYEDMNSGKLDATVSTSVAEKEVAQYRWKSILKVGYSPYYFAVSKKDPELYTQLNDAITKVLQSDWYYNEKIYLKYNGKTSASSAGLDVEDMQWLEEKTSIRVGYCEDALPYSDWNEKEGKMVGLLTTFLTHMKARYDVTLEPVRFKDYDELYLGLQQGNIDAIFPAYGSFWIAEENHLMVTEALTSSYLMMLYQGAFDETKTAVLAVAGGSPMQQFFAKEFYPDSRVLVCEDMEGCLEAVRSGRATATLMSSDAYYAYRNEFEDLSRLNISNTGYEVPVSFATRRDDVQMYRFLQKGLASITEKEIHEALISEGYANPEISVFQFFRKHMGLLMVLFDVFLVLILTLLIYYMISTQRTNRLSRHNTELNEKAYIDLATGLPNKNKCEEMLSSQLPVTKPTACFMLDLNDLKKVNDSLGHEIGDLMILNFAKLLRKVVPLQYFVGRYGGDEFIVIAENISGREEAEQLVLRIKEMIMKFNGCRGQFQLSYACGFAFSGEYPDASLSQLLNVADIEMYQDKFQIKQNRNQGADSGQGGRL